MRRAGTILWREIDTALSSEIAEGRYPAGSRLPAEAELAARFGVNRHTVRRALAELQSRGTISVERGRGMFVKSPRFSYPVSNRTRFSENVSHIAKKARGRMLQSWQMPATEKLARDLDIQVGATVIAFDDLRVIDGEPVSLTTHHFPADRFHELPTIFADTGSITESLLLLGVDDYTRRLTRVHARRSTPEEAALLKHEPDAPVLVVESINIDRQGRPIEFGNSRSTGGLWEIVLEGSPA
ncbi:phosphonate metabolism transcriptional regulator PhnF [Rhodoligotrophos defluvii]|uniref:phosphonate metabolism transcriptional regulator PhnF n=1 Tax=Rhodoligotrophos defluvii TaxID=2561934 RepID=UPI0010C99506|nr:phosphonate metabolism transcriptional regulator PhnF [Rhodoligotrophos defluvii]